MLSLKIGSLDFFIFCDKLCYMVKLHVNLGQHFCDKKKVKCLIEACNLYTLDVIL